MSNHTVPEGITDMRIDTFLSQELKVPRNKIQQIIRKGRVWVGTTIATKPARPVHYGETITITDGWDTNEFPIAENLPLSILYEDSQVILLNKPAGQVVHPMNKEGRGTVINALLYHFPEITSAVYDSSNQTSLLRPGIVHRLDKDTSGCLLIAKTQESMQNLAQQFREHTVDKEYLALLYGNMTDASDIHTSMRRQKKGNVTRMKAWRELDNGREARSVFTPVSHYSHLSKNVTEAQIKILTGRTHQIRSHARYIGHPVLGDLIYGTASSKNLSVKLEVRRQMLHASRLSFIHPVSNERMVCEAPIPSDYSRVREHLDQQIPQV